MIGPKKPAPAKKTAPVDNEFMKRWKAAKERDPGRFNQLDDGEYIMKLVGAKRGRSESSNRHQAVFNWVVAEGESKGAQYVSFEGLESEDNMFYFMRSLRVLGVEELPGSLEEIDECLNQLVQAQSTVKVKLVTKSTDQGDFQNLRIRRLVEATDEEVEAPAEEEVEEEASPVEEPTEETEEETTEEEEGVELAPGMRVELLYKGKSATGIVKEVMDDKCKVHLDGTKTLVTVPIESLESVIADDTPPPPPVGAVSKVRRK